MRICQNGTENHSIMSSCSIPTLLRLNFQSHPTTWSASDGYDASGGREDSVQVPSTNIPHQDGKMASQPTGGSKPPTVWIGEQPANQQSAVFGFSVT
ncbi:hypothetical protein Bca4012_018549 [Brassica carinata]